MSQILNICNEIAESIPLLEQKHYQDGKTEGTKEGYQNGYTEGHAQGVTEGHQAGYAEGHTAGITEGRESGLQEGYAQGKEDGYGEGQQVGYETGRTEGYEEGYKIGVIKGKETGGLEEQQTFWNAYQQGGDRTNYAYGFCYQGWNDSTFYPQHNMEPKSYAGGMFTYTGITNIKDRLEQCGVFINTKNATSFDNFYGYSSVLVNGVDGLDLIKGSSASGLCRGCISLISAPLKNIHNITNWNNAFLNCPLLTDIGQGNDDFGYFSTSVNLSQTAIDFGTEKMCLLALIASLMAPAPNPRQEDCFLRIGPPSRMTLTISTTQMGQIDTCIKAHSDGALNYSNFENACDDINWTVAVV